MADTEKSAAPQYATNPPSPLQRISSLAHQNVLSDGGHENDPVGGVTELVQGGDTHQTHYWFKRLSADRPLPSKTLTWLMLITLFTVMILAGWNDGTQGPLLPSLQVYYGVNYQVISIIWIFNALGFVMAALVNVWLTDRLGFGIVTPIGSLSQAVAYALMCWGGPYPVFILGFVINGFGLGLQDAQVNALTARLENASTKMFLMHAMYGVGATVSPLVATQFVKSMRDRVYLYYCVSLGLALVIVLLVVLAFNGRTEDQIVGHRAPEEETVHEPEPEPEPEQEGTSTEVVSADASAEKTRDVTPPASEPQSPTTQEQQKPTESGTKLKQIMKIPTTHFLAIFITFYVGVEVGIGGWCTSFLLTERNGNSSAGYVTAGYFGGLTVGRVVLIPVTAYLGKRTSCYVYSIIAIVLEIVIWTTKSLVGNAIAFAFVGVFLGPLYPIVMMVVVDIYPGELQGGVIGWIAALGQMGSALIPFITGSIAQRYGVWILQPFMVALMAFWMILWALVPRHKIKVRRS